jgi:bifunctional aspartokinase / homoserine dehydrogenase 1
MTDNARPLRVLKFGGTSVGDAQRISALVQIVQREAKSARCIVIVSAMGGVTQRLQEASELAAAGDAAYSGVLDEIQARHREALDTLVSADDLPSVTSEIEGHAAKLTDLLHGVSLVRECTPRTLDGILSFGELVSSLLVAAAFRKQGHEATACDARTLIRTDDEGGRANVDVEDTERFVQAYFSQPRGIDVVTGFIASSARGETTTLGRGGSDYTAALLGSLLGAERVEIWTDVDGVMSADPRIVPQAFSLPSFTYEELLELSHFGAQVVYPPSVHPARDHGIPLLIRNSLNPDFPGTWVGPGSWVGPEKPLGGDLEETPVRGISSIDDVALLRLEGDGMAGVPGIAERLFGSLARDGISVILISQASSEHSICLAVDPSAVAQARRGIAAEFRLELDAGLVDELIVEADASIIAAVGRGMRDRPGLAGRLFSVLGRRGINVRAIAQGSSELNISLVVNKTQVAEGLRALHDAFFEPPRKEAHLYLAGTGGVGGELIRQLSGAQEVWREDLGVDVRLVGISNSKRSIVDRDGLCADGWREALAGAQEPAVALVEAALADPAELRIFVDCSANVGLPREYAGLLRAGVPVVAANKSGFAASHQEYLARRRAPTARSYLEATVGAGLPVLRSVEDLRLTGDTILHAEGLLSGTLAYLFSEVMEGRPFSEAVVAARDLGYTEPDPRDDLSGQDVLRKLVILSREIGWQVEPEDVTVEPILPGGGWDSLSVDEFMARLPEVDDHFAALRAGAIERGTRLCFLGSVRNGEASVSVQEVVQGHPCHGLAGTDALVAIRTERYTSPLVIQGSGAGREVTAAGVLSDILRCVNERRWGSAP